MNNNNFEKWIKNFIKENKIDTSQNFKISKNGKIYSFTIGDVIGYIKLVSKEEKELIKQMLERIVKDKGNVEDYFQCLSMAIVNTYKESDIEENEEAM